MGLELRLYLVALAALTRCRLPPWVGYRPEWPQHSLRHFAGVGLLVGAGSALVVWTAGHLWPALVSVLCGMAFSLWMTAARHERGWALWCDGSAPAAPEPPASERSALEPPASAPPPLGAAGALGLLLVLALKAAALHGLVVRDLAAMLALLPLAHAWSRAGMVLLVVWRHQRPVGRQATAPAATGTPPVGLMRVVTLLWCAVATAAAALFVPATALVVAAVAACGVVLLVQQALHSRPAGPAGPAGPGLDAAQQGVELAVYLAVLGHLAQG